MAHTAARYGGRGSEAAVLLYPAHQVGYWVLMRVHPGRLGIIGFVERHCDHVKGWEIDLRYF